MESKALQDMLFYRTRISGNKEAIYDHDTGRRYTYGELYRRASQLAHFLVEDCHLKKGDCVGFFCSNHPAFFEAFFAGLQTGIIITTYNFRLNISELLTMMEHERPQILFYECSQGERIKQIRGRIEIARSISLDIPNEGDLAYEAIFDRPEVSPLRADLSEDDILIYFHTGGTTGTPKTAMISCRAVFYNCVCDIMTNALTMEDAELVFLPLFHTSGWNITTLPLLMCGGRIVLTRRFKAGTALKIIAQERPTVGMAVPAVYKALAAHPDFDKTDVSCFRWLASGGSTVQKTVMEAFWARGVPLTNGYGMTEVGPHNMTVPMVGASVEWLRSKWNSIGTPMYFNEVRIVDDQGRDVPDGVQGELLFKGPLVFSGYLNDPAESAAMIEDGWVHTGDIAWRDGDGYYYIAGRKKTMFISGGENIFPSEIEAVLGAFPAVKGVCVIGVPDERWGEVGKAILVVDPAVYEEEALLAFLKEHLSTIKIPRYFQITDHIPLNSAGKRDIAQIRALFGKI